jgi:hypothetical protein
MRHRLHQPRKQIWKTLRDAGLFIVVGMGVVLMALAAGLSIGLRIWEW